MLSFDIINRFIVEPIGVDTVIRAYFLHKLVYIAKLYTIEPLSAVQFDFFFFAQQRP